MSPQSYYSSPASYRVQKTLQAPLHFEGVGLHTGARAVLNLIPAPANHGIQFQKPGESGPKRLTAHYESVVCTALATSLGTPEEGIWIQTVEHLMSSLYSLGITNLLIEIQGPEVPILDGSASDFVHALIETGLLYQPYTTPVLKVKKPIKTYCGGAICELWPRDHLRVTASIDFSHPKIGLQTYAIDLTPQAFLSELAKARTFGFASDLEALKRRNLARGASLENVLAFSASDILNPEGTRFPDECVRHKVLDAIGDLALCGTWIQGEMVSFRGGHSIHLNLLKALKQHQSNWELIPAERIGSVSHLPAFTTSVLPGTFLEGRTHRQSAAPQLTTAISPTIE